MSALALPIRLIQKRTRDRARALLRITDVETRKRALASALNRRLAQLRETNGVYVTADEKWLGRCEARALYTMYTEEELTEPLVGWITRIRKNETRIQSRQIIVGDRAEPPPVLTLPTKVSAKLAFGWFFGRFPPDRGKVHELYGTQGEEWKGNLKQLLQQTRWTKKERSNVTELIYKLTDHWTAPPRSLDQN